MLEIVSWKRFDEKDLDYTYNEWKRGDIEDAFYKEVKEHKWCFSGNAHQSTDLDICPVPVLQDSFGVKKPFIATMRAWGDYMATAWNRIYGSKKFDYMDFYMSTPGMLIEKIPNYVDYKGEEL